MGERRMCIVTRTEDMTVAVQGELGLWRPDPILLTVRQVAQVLNIGRSTVYELIAAHKLEVVHVGRSARIPADSVQAFVAGLRAETDHTGVDSS
jgi:excisionase family DNA binding protein